MRVSFNLVRYQFDFQTELGQLLDQFHKEIILS